MTPERHARIKELFLVACRLPLGEQATYIATACHEDTELRTAVEELLAQHREDTTRGEVAPGVFSARRAAERACAGPVGLRTEEAGRRLGPGTLFAARFRIVALLGEGGMGEVYRADDLKLGQPVALKFLPAWMAFDPAWLARFYQEVRVAREVTSPFVCRVYDIFETSGVHFISMEYVDGEDLRNLLSRLGRLPQERAAQIGRQICAGLAAAHARGVLHRDLKPAKIMPDGRGQLRITDFGLAARRENIPNAEVQAGTPAYMAPEQLEGRDVSVRSDVYALGLVLYELFTGRPAFHADMVAEYRELKRKPPPPATQWVPDLAPVIECVLQECLNPDPALRPATVLAVAAALPATDALTAALAANATPSPELVAAAGPVGAVRGSRVAVGLALFVLLLGVMVAVTPWSHPVLRAHFQRAPGVLEERAHAALSAIGATDTVHDEAAGLVERLRFAGAPDERAAPRGAYATTSKDDVVFWYRGAPTALVPEDAFALLFGPARITPDDPPLTDPGMASAVLDGAGRLLGFEVVLTSLPSPAPAPPDWGAILGRADLDLARLTVCEPRLAPRVPADFRRAWCGVLPGSASRPIRVEAAERAGRAVSLAIVDDPPTARADTETRAAIIGVSLKVLLAVLIPASVVLTRRNLAQGRADTRGALRLAIFVFVARMGAWLLQAHHVANGSAELRLLAFALTGGLAMGMLAWVGYLALEPYARRAWPQLLIGWTRALSGRWRDPLVGADLLLGAVLGAYWAVLMRLEGPLTVALGLAARESLR
jgi:serine/threonine-protein kinase